MWCIWQRSWSMPHAGWPASGGGGVVVLGCMWPSFVSLFASKQPTIFRWQPCQYPLYDSVWPPLLWKILATPMDSNVTHLTKFLVHASYRMASQWVMLQERWRMQKSTLRRYRKRTSCHREGVARGGVVGCMWTSFVSLFVSKQPTIFRWQSGEYPLYDSVWPPPPPPLFEKSWLRPCIVVGLKWFAQYVQGRLVKMETDHKPLESIIKKSTISAQNVYNAWCCYFRSIRMDLRCIWQIHSVEHLFNCLLLNTREEMQRMIQRVSTCSSTSQSRQQNIILHCYWVRPSRERTQDYHKRRMAREQRPNSSNN